MKEIDLAYQNVVCGDMVSNIAMAVQQLEKGEEAKIILPIEYKESVDVYREALKIIGAEVLEVREENSKLILVVKRV